MLIVSIVLFFVAQILLFKFLYYRKQQQKCKQPWIFVGQVKKLFIYPVKSFRHLQVESAEVTKLGLKSGQMIDRHFVVSDANGKYVTAPKYPRFVLINASVHNDVLKLWSDPCPEDSVSVDLQRVVLENNITQTKVWENVSVNGYDCGQEVGDWIARFVSEPHGTFRLLYYCGTEINERHVGMNKFYKQYSPDQNNLRRNDKIAFPYFGTVTLQCQSSLDDLNTRFTSDMQFPMEIFRSNLIVGGTKPYDEDNWDKIRIGAEAQFSYAMPCVRCAYIAIDPSTGRKRPDLEPLRTLQQYQLIPDERLKPVFRNEPVFGANLLVDSIGYVKIGDPVYVQYKKCYS